MKEDNTTTECNKCGSPTLQEHYCVICYTKYVLKGRETIEDMQNYSRGK